MTWIDTPDRSPDTLARWLLGYDLPPVDTSEEPYVRLLRAIPVGQARPRYEWELARSAASLVERIPELPHVVQPRRGDEFFYNLLSLCAGLRARDILSSPLRSLLDNNPLAERSYSALPLNDTLRSALIINQADNALEPIWESIAAGQPHPVIRGTPHDGFQGALYMPPSADRRGEPAIEAIGRALSHLASHFTPRAAQRVRLFRSVLNEVMDRYPGHDWDMQMIRYSDEHGWPDWTDVALPSVNLAVSEDRYLVWWPIFDCVARQYGIEARKVYCSDRVIETVLDNLEARSTAMWLAKIVEQYRTTTSFGGDNAIVGVLSAAFEEAGQYASQTRSTATAKSLRETHFELLATFLHVQIEDESGQPIEGAEVVVSTASPAGSVPPRMFKKTCRARTGIDGRATLPGVLRGHATFMVSAPTYEPRRMSIVVSSGENVILSLKRMN